MARTLLTALILLLVLATGWAVWFWQPGAAKPPASVTSGPTGGDFALRSADGEVALHDFRGKVVLLYFGYTFCPDVCPTSLGNIARALDSLSREELARTRVLFISVDPERDTPERLKRYAAFFHPAILGLTGEPSRIAAVAKLYGAAYRRQNIASAGGYVVDHSSATYVVDPSGRLFRTLQHGTPPPDMAEAIRAALAISPQAS